MSALLSPPRPVRTRFKVPGEGAYELCADLPPPPTTLFPPPPPAPPAKTTPPSSNSATPPAAPAFVAGPLGLPKVTKLSFAQRATLQQVPTPPDVDPPPSKTPPSVSPRSASSAAPPSTSSIFSFRNKFTSFTTLSAKFSSAPDPLDDPASASSSPTGHASTSTPPPETDPATPRFPPRVASARPKDRPTARRPDPPEAHPPTPAGVLAYNASDTVVLVDMRLHAAAPTTSATPAAPAAPATPATPASPATPDASLTLQTRSPPTAQSLYHASDALRLLVGCANGEVVYYPDLVAQCGPIASEGKKSRSVAAVATLVSVASGMNGSPSPANANSSVHNKDGASNSTRVVAVSWVPRSTSRFMSVHADGNVVVYDSRFRPSAGSLRANVAQGQNAAAGAAAAAAAAATTANAGAAGSSSGQAQTQVGEGGMDGVAGSGGTGTSSQSSSSKSNGSERGNVERTAHKNDVGDGEQERSGLSSGSGEKAPVAPTHRRTGSTIMTGAMGAIGQHDILVTRQGKGKKSNPTAVWQIGRAAITACEFSPALNGETSSFLAVTGRDGYLRILDFTREVPLAAFRSYFGAFLCVSWSPDGRYVATGGEDDLVSIFCPSEERLVARLEGHTSWVSAVAWDASLSVPGRYRIGSAGQDAKLLLWDFALDMLHHRTSQSRLGAGVVRLRSYVRDVGDALNHSGSSSSNGNGLVANGTASPSLVSSERRTSKLSRLRGHGTASTANDGESSNGNFAAPQATPVVVSALGRAEVPIVEPVVAHVAHGEPLTDVWFQECGVFTADSMGTVKMWSRPATHAVPELSLQGGGGVARKGAAADLD